MEEERKELIILDEGIDMDDLLGPRGLCCRGSLSPLRG